MLTFSFSRYCCNITIIGISQAVRENVLVDFVRKDWDPVNKTFVVEQEEEAGRSSSEEMKKEFIDEFGRSRLVTLEEYEALVKAQQKLANQLIETMRKQDDNFDGDGDNVGPAHYDDTKEIRTKGIGFYRFSQSESERQGQLAELNALRQSTLEGRTKSMILKEQRRLMKESRLAKVQERRTQQQQHPEQK